MFLVYVLRRWHLIADRPFTVLRLLQCETPGDLVKLQPSVLSKQARSKCNGLTVVTDNFIIFVSTSDVLLNAVKLCCEFEVHDLVVGEQAGFRPNSKSNSFLRLYLGQCRCV
jgi:hypothetical protein